MRPDANARRVLSVTRSKAKMYEYKVPLEDHIALPQNPNILFSLAVGLLGDGAAEMAATFIARGPVDQTSARQVFPPTTWDAGDNTIRETNRESLRFAAIYFDSYLSARLNIDLTAEFSLLCASSYELAESIGSARVIARRSDLTSPNLANILGLLVHKLLLDDYSGVPDGYVYSSPANGLLSNLRVYLDGGASEAELQRISSEMRWMTYRHGDAKELLYADLAIAIISRRMANSSRRRLPSASGLGLELWQPALAKSSFPRHLWPAQQRICDARLLLGQSAVIQMPTSAGKTRATELIIRSSFLSSRTTLAVIVAPFRSLCHEIRSDLVRAFAEENVELNEATDTFEIDFDIEALLSRKSILIATPEKLLYVLRREPEFAKQIGLIIYDEGHQFDGMARGPTYELLLTSLKIELKAETQVVFISAVIGNAPAIAGWLVQDENAVVSSEGLLPTPKSIAFASWQDVRGRLEYVSPADPNESEFFVPRVIEKLGLRLRKKERKSRYFPDQVGTDIGLYLSIQLASNGGSAVFCGRKDSASGLCERAVDIFSRGVALEMPRASSDAEELDRIAHLIRSNIGDHTGAAAAAQIGILQHHGNIPQGLRLSVEHAMKDGLAKVVVCTSTLAQGVNFPIKYLIVTTVHQGQEQIKVRDFHNLIGRAGRAGMHTEGSVIFASPDVFDERNSRNPWRWRSARSLLDPANSEPCNSAILNLLVPYRQDHPPAEINLTPEFAQLLVFASPDNIREIVDGFRQSDASIDAKIFEVFLHERARVIQSIAAYLIAHESPDSVGGIEDIYRLVSSTLAYYLATDEQREALKALVVGVFLAINEHATSADRKALIRKSPLPPASVIALESWLAANVSQIQESIARDDLATFSEKTVIRHISARLVKEASDAEAIVSALRMWIEGETFTAIYSELKKRDVRVRASRIKADDVVALCENAFGFEGAMIVASLADLSDVIDEDMQKAFSKLQKNVRYGLTLPSEIALYEMGFADRVIAQKIASYLDGISNKSSIRSVLRTRREDVITELASFPTYFTKVLYEITG